MYHCMLVSCVTVAGPSLYHFQLGFLLINFCQCFDVNAECLLVRHQHKLRNIRTLVTCMRTFVKFSHLLFVWTGIASLRFLRMVLILLLTGTTSAQVGFKMFLGVSATVTNWDAEGTSCSLVLEDNPLVDFVELPDTCQGLCYCNILSGVIRGALEMVNF